MKNYRLPLAGFAIVLLIASCKKQDVQLNSASKTTAISSVGATKTSGWNSLTNWSSAKNGNTTTYFSTISDTAITADVAKSGLVLVYTKNGSAVQSLPFQDKSTNTNWYYQVSKGSVRINGDNNASQNFSGQNFSYLVLTSQQLSSLQEKGKTKLDLMQMPYDQIQPLLK